MSLLPHSVFPRSMFDMDQWFRHPYNGPSTLDLFDPFDELDHTISRNLHWLTKPEFLQTLPLVPKVPQKYRITIDCSGFAPKSIKTEIKAKHKLVVTGLEEHKDGEDFTTREFKKTYQLPENCESEKLVTFMAPGGKLVVEVPLKETKTMSTASLVPQIVDNKDGTKNVSVNFNIPHNLDPSKVQVSIKDRDIICRAEDEIKKPDLQSKYYYYMV
jgi:HSP20 family molecular chaperone IbpA